MSTDAGQADTLCVCVCVCVGGGGGGVMEENGDGTLYIIYKIYLRKNKYQNIQREIH